MIVYNTLAYASILTSPHLTALALSQGNVAEEMKAKAPSIAASHVLMDWVLELCN